MKKRNKSSNKDKDIKMNTQTTLDDPTTPGRFDASITVEQVMNSQTLNENGHPGSQYSDAQEGTSLNPTEADPNLV